MKDSSESSAEEQSPKGWGDELLAPVTPTPKSCRGTEKFPQKSDCPHQPRKHPKTSWEERGAIATTCFLIQILTLTLQPPPSQPRSSRRNQELELGRVDWSSRHLHGPQPAEGRGRRAGPGPQGLHPLAGLFGRPKPEALGMKSFFPSNFKGSQTQGSPRYSVWRCVPESLGGGRARELGETKLEVRAERMGTARN